MYPFAHDIDFDRIGSADLLYFETDGCSGFAFHHFAAFGGLQPEDILPVNGKYHVSGLQPGFDGRAALVWLVDDDSLSGAFENDCSYASVSTRNQHLQLLMFLFRYVYGIWIKAVQHGFDTVSEDFIELHGIYIAVYEFFYYGVVDLYRLAVLEILGLSVCMCRQQYEDNRGK